MRRGVFFDALTIFMFLSNLFFLAYGVDVSLVAPSGSMYPTIKNYDMIFVELDPESLAVGDVVIYWAPWSGLATNECIVHRVIAVVVNGSAIEVITKGDNNTAPDPPVTLDNIRGVVVGRVPFPASALLFALWYHWLDMVFSLVMTARYYYLLPPRGRRDEKVYMAILMALAASVYAMAVLRGVRLLP